MRPSPSAPPDPNTPQVVLFGLPRSGKSALLEALERGRGGRRTRLALNLTGAHLDPWGVGANANPAPAEQTGNLTDTDDTELTSWLVTLERRDGDDYPLTAVVHDCSGDAALHLLDNPEVITTPGARAPVARAIARADAIALLVDASSDEEQLQFAFEEFDTFLTLVSQSKATAREVGGFPVVLVLTHADKLAMPGDTVETWERRLEKRAEKAVQQFDKFLRVADEETDIPSPFLPFGKIDLSVETVAIRFPKLASNKNLPGVADPAGKPYRVAELFRSCFRLAHAHRKRVTASNRRLLWTVRLSLSLVGLLFLAVLGMVAFPPRAADPGLAARVISYQLNEPEAAVRLAFPYLTRNKQTLTAFREDPGFSRLPEELRTFVLGRLREIEDYEAYRTRLAATTAPGDTRSLEELAHVEQTLQNDLRLPAEYAWGQTQAAALRQKWLADVVAIRKAEQRYLDRYREFLRRGVVLMLQPSLGNNWRAEVNDLVAEAGLPPDVLSDPLAGSPAIDHPRGQAVTNRVPFEFERIYGARKEWEATRDRLLRLRDLGDALGLTAGPDRPDAVLVLPEPGPGVNSMTLPASRWAALLRSSPFPLHDGTEFRDWEIRNFPDPIRSVLADRIDHCFRTGVRHVHALIREKMGPDPQQKDTPTGWRSLVPELSNAASPFPDWGKFLHLLARLRDPAAANPVAQLQTFLSRDRFPLEAKGFDLVIPPDLSLERVSLAGPLVITLVSSDGQPVTRSFKPVGPAVRVGSGLSYRLMAESEAPLTYRPGDDLKAEIPLRAGNRELRLVWESGKSRVYQFDRLRREPRVLRQDGGTEPASGVILTPTAGSDWPVVPELLPDLSRP